MQHPWHLGFGLYMTQTPVAILVWNWEEGAKQEREKRVTPEFGERKEKKILPQIQGVTESLVLIILLIYMTADGVTDLIITK
jgi:hypothetical protein